MMIVPPKFEDDIYFLFLELYILDINFFNYRCYILVKWLFMFKSGKHLSTIKLEWVKPMSWIFILLNFHDNILLVRGFLYFVQNL